MIFFKINHSTYFLIFYGYTYNATLAAISKRDVSTYPINLKQLQTSVVPRFNRSGIRSNIKGMQPKEMFVQDRKSFRV